MTHILPPHTDINLVVPTSIQSALQMDQQSPTTQQQQQQPTTTTTTPTNTTNTTTTTSRKRKKNDSMVDDPTSHPEPRRLRRSHEACARCRNKKIKCDSKHPRCSACEGAGVACHQEDRHRQTLITRGHTERVEQQLIQCDALLKRHIPGFDLNNLEDILAREGIDINPTAIHVYPYPQPTAGPSRPFPLRPDPLPQQHKSFYQQPPPHIVHPGYPHPIPMSYAPPPPPGSPFPPPHLQIQPPPPGPYNPHIHPAFQHPQPIPVQPPVVSNDIKGQDPKSNDMSNTESLAKNFGVHSDIVSDLKLADAAVDKEDLAVGSSGLSSGRDRDVVESSIPRDTTNWVSISMRRNNTTGGLYAQPISTNPTLDVWVPKDRSMVKRIVDVYFTRLNYHRPVFVHKDFMKELDGLYEGQAFDHDPGFVCSLYLILGLGTLSELNHRVTQSGERTHISPAMVKKFMPADWPEHDEFLARALAVKPDLRVTISSLQALVLLHWYLYTERQGRTLWRLVGSLVRLSIELGLHHDPTTQQATFTEEESQLRIRLWGIVMVHDRGTSILLGRPLAIAPFDSNTPRPTHAKVGAQDFSEHFLLSHPVAEIQADIINSLYTPMKQTGDGLMRHATRIIKSMVEFRKTLPESYQYYFSGTDEWPLDKRTQLVQEITEDQGLTLLKIGISRILLLRALFSSKELTYAQRHKALVDAVITSHNIVIIHNQLIRFPDIAFFTSPIPLHIAAMVILYGHMSRCDSLPKQVALEDLWMALDMLPRFRWRWERKDLNGGHPLIEKLAERVMEVNLHQLGPSAHPTLVSERDWDMVKSKSQQTTPTLSHAFTSSSPGVYGSQNRVISPLDGNGHANGNGSSSSSGNGNSSNSSNNANNGNGNNNGNNSPDKRLVEVPTGLFYPFYPESQFTVDRLSGPQVVADPNGNGTTRPSNSEFGQLLADVPHGHGGPYGCDHNSFMLDEKDPSLANGGGGGGSGGGGGGGGGGEGGRGGPVWMNVRGLRRYPGSQP